MLQLKEKTVYHTVNCIINVVIFALLCRLFKNKQVDDFQTLLILIGSAILVLTFKFIRLYIILFGRDISFMAQLQQYCKLVPASILFPFKLGELFRMYCYGYHMNNYVEGMICILFDRFVDSVALLTIIFGIQIMFGMNSSIILNLLVLFSVCVFIAYHAFRPLYKFWNDFFISSNASRRRLKALAFLKTCNMAYGSVDRSVKGKFLMLYVLSLLAWGIELGGLVLANWGNGDIRFQDRVYEYLTAALTGKYSTYMKNFSLVSIVILLVCYLMTWVYRMMKQQREKA